MHIDYTVTQPQNDRCIIVQARMPTLLVLKHNKTERASKPEGGDGMYMSVQHPGNAPGHKVPYCYPTIITAHCQQSATAVECTGECFTARVQDTITMLQVSMATNVHD